MVSIDPKTLKPDVEKTIKSSVPKPDPKKTVVKAAAEEEPAAVVDEAPTPEPAPALSQPDENGMTPKPWHLRFIGDGSRRLVGQPMTEVRLPAHRAQRLLQSGLYERVS